MNGFFRRSYTVCKADNPVAKRFERLQQTSMQATQHSLTAASRHEGVVLKDYSLVLTE